MELNDQFIRDVKVPPKRVVINTILIRTPLRHEVWLRIGTKHWLAGSGTEAKMTDKKLRIERFLSDHTHWSGIKSFHDIIEVSKRL